MQIKTFHHFILSIILMLAAFSGTAGANSSSYYDGDGTTIFPIANNFIAMKSEVVRIKPDTKNNGRWLADCEFNFHNKSDLEHLVTMGYPDWLDNYFDQRSLKEKDMYKYLDFKNSDDKNYKILDDDPIWGQSKVYLKGYRKGLLPYFKVAWKVHDLKVQIDGKSVKYSHKPIDSKIKVTKRFTKEFANGADDPAGAFIWKVQFKPNELKTVKVSFSFSGLNEADGIQEVSYIMKTGALWADVIESADIYWSLKGQKIKTKDIYPKGYSIEDNIIHWHFDNYKPDKDISIFLTRQVQ